MTAYTWIGGTGNWKTAGDWSPAGPPTATDTATISETGSAYTVTINSVDVAQSLTENSSSATVDDVGSLTLSSTFTLSAGTFILGPGGTLSGGTTKLAGGTFTCDGGTLSGVTYDGALDLSELDASIYIASGTAVNNAAGTGAGTINDTGYGSALYFDNTQTFNNVTINLGATAYSYNSYLYEYDATGSGTVLTLGSNVAIDESGYAQIADSGYAGDGIVNQGAIKQSGTGSSLQISGNALTNSGTITAASSGGALTIKDATFTNSGTLAISNGDSVTIEPANFTNAAAGVISIGANSTLTLAMAGSWSNQGSITLASGSSLYLGGSFTYAGLGKLTNSGGTLYIEGTFTNTGRLNGTNALGPAVLYGGTIQGGIAALAGLAFSSYGGTLSGVTYDGALNLSASDDTVNLANGTVVNNALGNGAGTINDTGYDSILYFNNTQTFNNVTINLGAALGNYEYISYLKDYDQTGAGTVLTLGSSVTIDERGNAQIADSGGAGDGIVNQGAIKQMGTSSQLTFTGNSLTNSGTIAGASNQGGLTIEDATFTNTGTITASASDAALTIESATFTNKGAIDISGGDDVTIEPTSFTNAAAGVISVGADSTLNLAPGGSWSNLGSITLASGSALYVDMSFTVASLGSISNSGGTVYVEGTLNNAGGTLNGSSDLGQAALDGGTVQGGAATPSGLVSSDGGGTLSGVTYDGTLDLSGDFVSVDLANGAVVNNAAGNGAGTINDTGFDSTLYFDNTQTFNNATIDLGNTAGYYSFLTDNDLTGAGTVLTLGSSVTIDESGYGYIEDSGEAGDGIVNQGAITQSGTSSYVVFNGNSLTNNGTITGASSDGVLTIDDVTFTNSGTLGVSNGDALILEATNFSNNGSITLGSGSSLYLDIAFTLAELGTLTNSGGTVYIDGTLDLTGGTLNASSGFGQAVLDGGTVDGGTVASSVLALFAASGTLSGVTYDGTLDLSEVDASVQLASGTVVNNAAGTGAGTINDTGEGSTLYFDNTQTFNNATINLGSTSGYYYYNSFLEEYDQTGAGTVLTLGSNVTIDESGYAQIADSGYTGDRIVNQGAIKQSGSSSQLTFTGNCLTNSGTISGASIGGGLTIDDSKFTNNGTIAAGASGGTLTIEPATFTNNGAIDISDGDTATIEPTNFTNAAAGVISVGGDSTLNLAPGGSWSNLGSITLASGSSLFLGGSFTIAGLGSITNSGSTVYIEGTLNNTGGALNGTNVLGQAVLDGGTIQGGAATPSGLVFSDGGGTLSGVTYDGNLDLSGPGDSVSLASGTTVNNAAGTGAGTINDTSQGSTLYFDNTQTFSAATINLGCTPGAYSFLEEYDQTGAGTVLTLGSNITIDESGYAQIADSGYAGDSFVNQGAITQSGTSSQLTFTGNCLTNNGTITGDSSGGALMIADITFTNNGTIDIANGDSVTINPATFTNLSSETLTGGTYEAEAGSTLQVDAFGPIVTLDADVILSGSGSQFLANDGGSPTAIDSTLRMIGASGELQLLAGRNWTAAGAAIANDGMIALGGGILTATGPNALLTDAAGASLVGFGTVTATEFVNSGTIEAAGGTLTLTDGVTGTGGLQIDAGADLVVGGAIASDATATFNGAAATLTLNQVSTFDAIIGGIIAGDVIDLVGITANEATPNGSNQLVVTESGTTVATLQLNAAYPAFSFVAEPGSNGTNIVVQQNTVIPNAPTLSDGSVVNGYINAAADLASQTLGGTALAGSTVNVYLNGSTTAAYTTVANPTGAWSVTLGTLTDGTYNFTATATDAAGNTSEPSAAYAFAVDTVAPTVSATEIVSGLTNQTSDTFTVSATAEAVGSNSITGVQIYSGTTLLGSAAQGPNGNWSYTATGLTDGTTYNFSAVATDAAGNTNTTTVPSVTVDTETPAVATISPPAGTLTSASQTITGTVSENVEANVVGSTVALYDNGSTTPLAIAIVQAGEAGVDGGLPTWSAAVTLSPGSNSIVAEDTDLATNIGASSPVVYTVVTLVQPTITSATYSGSTTKGSWTLGGMATAGSMVTVYDGATVVGTTTATTGGTWTDKTSANESAITDFTVISTVSGTTPLLSAPYYEGTPLNDVFDLASGAAVSAAALINGGAGTNTLQMTSPSTLSDADFAHIEAIEILGLTGASSVSLGPNALAAGIKSVTLGNGNTSITDSNSAMLTVSAADLGAGNVLSLAGSTAVTVTGLTGNLDASGDSGALAVTATGTTAQSIATGSGAMSISDATVGGSVVVDATALGSGTLTLSGSAAKTVNNLTGNVVATSQGKNTLTVNAIGSGAQSVTTGTGNTTITDNGSGSMSVNANATGAGRTLTLSGSAAETVTNLAGNIVATSESGALTVTTTGVTQTVTTGSNNISITDDSTGTLTVNGAALGSGSTLTVTGSGPVTVTNLKANLNATGDTGALTVTATGTTAQSIATGSGAMAISDATVGGSVVVDATALGSGTLTLSGSAAKTVNNLTGNVVATSQGNNTLTVNAIGSGAQSVTTGAGNTTITDDGSGSMSVNANATGAGRTLTLSGSAAETVTNLAGNIVATSESGALTVTTTGVTQTVTTGSDNISITDDSTGTLTVNGAALGSGSTLTVMGSGPVTVTNLKANLNATGDTGALTVTATGTTAQSIATGSGATSIADSASGGSVVVDATLLGTGTLTLSGSAAKAVSNLTGNLVASGAGALNVTTGVATAVSVATGNGSNVINADAMTTGETLTVTGTHAATLTVGGNLAAGSDTGALTVTASGSGPQTIQTGTGKDTITAFGGGDTIQAGGGGDSINVLGHVGADSFVYAATSDSLNTTAGHDTITGFSASDLLNFSLLNPSLTIGGFESAGAKIAADSIEWINLGASGMDVFVNNTAGALANTNSSLMEITLAAVSNLSSLNFKA